ncbi:MULTISPECIES: hypothetical protein [Phaeobacter]|uniref:hypothetical protein n=1 Tax=Phaeobacter TaxID=302485 RepID=UPI00058B99D2|nr:MULTISPECIES: hypothetical protein [Phaeobacter]AUQ89421.1 hypothetical protein PhaeoP24_00775 [Phaeobacter inhibens]KII12569.1 hypothetical protein OO25_16885 [Phaeobacter sp. S60]
MITLAFYKGLATTPWHRLQDAGIRFATGGRYSHVEFIAGAAEFHMRLECLSSSGRDGGVRSKMMVLRPANWDLVQLAIDPDGPVDFIRSRIGARYDYTGLLLSHVLAFGHHDKDRWFCSEVIAAALGLPNPQRLSPQLLFDVVTWGQRQAE